MLTLNDGRAELWQWDTGRTLSVDADCSQVHFSNNIFGRSVDVDVTDGVAIIPDILLQSDKDLNVWAFVGTAENGYTKISKTFKVNRRNRPADYVFTPPDQITLQTIQRQIGDLSDLTTEAKDTLVAAINEASRTGGGGGGSTVEIDTTLTQPGKAADAAEVGNRLSALSEEMLTDAELSNAVDNALARAKESGEFNGAKGDPGVGIQSVAQTTTSTEDGGTNIVTVTKTDGTTSTFEVRNGGKGTTPQKGTDYWTTADQQAIVDDVLAALPTWEGGSY